MRMSFGRHCIVLRSRPVTRRPPARKVGWIRRRPLYSQIGAAFARVSGDRSSRFHLCRRENWFDAPHENGVYYSRDGFLLPIGIPPRT